MTGRPPLPIGAHGVIPPPREVRPGVWEARTRVKDPDGVLRPVKRQGRSATAARNNLQQALSQRRHNAGAALTGNSRVDDAAQAWLTHQRALVAAGDRAPGTLENYESVWRCHIAPALGQLRLREATTARCEAWLVELRRHLGPSRCVAARAVLSGILGHAARLDALDHNPVRDLSPIPGAGSRKRKPRAMTAQERADWLSWLDTHVARNPRHRNRAPALQHDEASVIAGRALGDIVRFMLGTGVRIGEAMAVSWDEVDLEAGTVAIRWHIVRVKGVGLVRAPGAKSEAGDRVLRLPSWCRDMLMRRRVDPASGYPVFPNELGAWRDPQWVLRWIRWSRDEAGFGWVTSHVFRQTVISALDDAGLSTREVADHAGHARTAQTQAYMARRVASERAAEALEDLL
jgi:integrase